jgi:hypothetical protein
MININSIKELLELGATIKFPHKSKINEWYSEVEFYKYKDRYCISNHKDFTNIQDAISYWSEVVFSSKNYGYIQKRLSYKIDLEQFDLEKPNKKLINLFKEEAKLVDEEYSKLNIKKYTEPSIKDAIRDIKLFKNINSGKMLSEYVHKFRTKYEPLGNYINLVASFELEGYTHDYTKVLNIEDISNDNVEYKIDKLKSTTDFKISAKFKKLILKATIAKNTKNEFKISIDLNL